MFIFFSFFFIEFEIYLIDFYLSKFKTKFTTIIVSKLYNQCLHELNHTFDFKSFTLF